MQRVTFASKPKTKTLGMPNDLTHCELTKAATDTSGKEWAQGTQLRGLYYGSGGFVYMVTSAKGKAQ